MFKSDTELFGFITDSQKNSEPSRTQLAQNFAVHGCYFEGLQWLNQFTTVHNRSGLTRAPVDYRPDSAKLRVVENRTTMLTQKSIASTHPEQIILQVEPPELDTSIEAMHKSRVHEVALNAEVQWAKYINAARRANHCRGVFGVWGLLLTIENTPSGMYICVNDFDPTCLSLEPSCQRLQLHEHPYVHYSDTWTLDRIERAFKVKLNPDDARTVEQLEALKVEMCGLSNNKLFTRYATQSKAKAARVHQIHVRGQEYRFDKWYVAIEKGPNDFIHVNADNIDTPFGGVGLPMVLLHGYQRADSMWSWGEPAQLKDAQDRKNLLGTQKARIEQKYAGPDRFLVDERAFGQGSHEDIAKKFTNQINGLIMYKGSERGRNVNPPQLIPSVPIPQFLAESLAMYDIEMRDKTHKAEGNFGGTKSHVPDSTQQRVLDEADQVASARIVEDVSAHEFLVGVLHGTVIKHLQAENQPTAMMLSKAGFQPQDFAILAGSDPSDPGVVITVEQASIRARSKASKKQDLFSAAQAGMIDAEQFQAGMADLELPLSSADKQMTDQIRRSILDIIYGAEWPGQPMGKWNRKFIDSLIEAQFDPRVRLDPSALQRIVSAIQSQYQMMYQEQIMSNPELAMQAQQQQQPQPGAEAEQPAESGAPVSVADVLDSLTAAGPASR